MGESNIALATGLSASMNGANQNVFSRLANPKHYVSTSRTKAQEIETRKLTRHNALHAREQESSSSRAQKEREREREEPYTVHTVHQSHQKGVFQRLHSTSIRNTRLHLNSSCNGEEQMNFNPNSSILSVPDDDHPHAPITGMLLGAEPARVGLNQSEMAIAKKPQRVSKAASSLLMAGPTRILS